MNSVNKDANILEGFLCPICMEDLASITQLQAHFEEKHESVDKSGLPSFKGFLTKAKKKFLIEEDIDKGFSSRLKNPFANENNECQGVDPWDWEIPYSVPSRDHSSAFKKIRSGRIDSFVAETNKLLIRLDKLLTRLPSDPNKRKVHEKEIVSWVNNKDVPLCPFCASSFTIARRRHHCRLCGAIMCDDCSQFLSLSYAEKLISPVHQGDSGVRNSSVVEEKTSTGPFGLIFGGFSGLKRSGSHGSLNSILSSVDVFGKEKGIRTCTHCLTRLAVRERQVEQRTSRPLLSVYYDKLIQNKTLLCELLPQYSKMAESLMDGDTTYHLSDAEELRMRILKLSDSISMTAQKIRNLGAAGVALEGHDTPTSPEGGEKAPPYPRQEVLQRRIHSSTVTFLKENVLNLPKLPTKEDLVLRRERKRRETEARLLMEEETARLAEEKASLLLRRKRTHLALDESARGHSPFSKSFSANNSSSSSFSSSNSSTPNRRHAEMPSVVYDNGWGADTSAHRVTETDDPIVQQMNVIRNYIKQAREASKYDEVAILEANLKELQIEYKRKERSFEL